MRILLLIALLLKPLGAAAEVKCANTLPPSELQKCSEAMADEVQQRMDQLMKALKKSSTAKNWDHLKTAQILWEKTRAHDCRVFASYEELPVQTSVRYQCEAWYTRDRIHQIRYALCPRYWRTGQCDAEKVYN